MVNSNIGSTKQYNVGEKPTVILYTFTLLLYKWVKSSEFRNVEQYRPAYKNTIILG